MCAITGCNRSTSERRPSGSGRFRWFAARGAPRAANATRKVRSLTVAALTRIAHIINQCFAIARVHARFAVFRPHVNPTVGGNAGCYAPTASQDAARPPSCLRAFVPAFLILPPILLTGVPAVASDPAVRDTIRRGNEFYEAGEYRKALDAYTQLDPAPEDPAYADWLHDQAAAQFKLGHYDDARELWVRAASLKDAAFEARARYNIGNCDYAEALTAVRPPAGGGPSAPPPGQPQSPMPLGQPAGAPASQPTAPPADPIELLDHAIASYRDALRLDPTLANARANLELAAKLKKLLEEQQKDQPQSQPSQNKQDQNKQDKQQKQDQQQQNQQNQQDQQDQQDQQSQRSQQKQQQSDSAGQQQDQQQNQSSEQDQQPKDGQQQGQQNQKPQSNPEQKQRGSANGQQTQQAKLSPAEARRLLQMIRDAEKRRREMLRARQAAGQKKVDKDW